MTPEDILKIPARVLTQPQREHYFREGYILLERIIGDEWIRKLRAATRGMFTRPGWFGAFDNCLWDIAGKVAGLPVYALIGRARARCPAYYNIRGARGREAQRLAVEDSQLALSLGFPAVSLTKLASIGRIIIS